MEHLSLLHLQNGSDIRGVALDGVDGEEVNLTPHIAYCIGIAFAEQIARRTGKKPGDLKLAVGRDARLTGETLLSEIAAGAHSEGAVILDCGLASTPAMFMSTLFPETGCDGACMVTASHLPYNRNGFKFFDATGGFEKEDIKEILERAATLAEADTGHCDLLALYTATLRDVIKKGVQADDYEHPLKGLHIVVDAGNGNGGFFVTDVLDVLGADTSGSQYLEPDGTFPNHIPNPENNPAMRAICDATVAAGADLGLIFDTDVDRMSAVFADGTPVGRDTCIALSAAILAPEHKGATIVTDSVTSDRLTAFLEDTLGLKHLCYKRGYKNIINKCIELNEQGVDCPLAMETSGHGCLKENHYLDDGAYLAVRIIIALAKARAEGKKLSALIEDFSMRFSAREVRLNILDKDFAPYGQEVLDTFRTRAEKAGYELPDTFEGVRVRFAPGSLDPDFLGGWLILRASLHDPEMVLNMEGVEQKDLYRITLAAKRMMEDLWKLDISMLDH